MSSAVLAFVAGGDDQDKAAPLGLFVLVLLGVASYFLFKSMSRHLRRVRDEFPPGGVAVNGTESLAADVLTTGSSEGLIRPAPVTVTRVRTVDPRDTATRSPGQRSLNPRVIEPGIIEPGISEPGIIEPGIIEPGISEPRIIEIGPDGIDGQDPAGSR